MKMKILDQKGQGLTEYIALLLLISVASIGVTKTFGKAIKTKIIEAREEVNSIKIDKSGGGDSGGVFGGGGNN
jgi:Flp pilus assembly pilin Flp